jgi:hypothetical protein
VFWSGAPHLRHSAHTHWCSLPSAHKCHQGPARPCAKTRGEIVTKTQKLRPALSCEPLPNHVLPLAHFGAISDVCDGGVVRTDHHNTGERRGSTQHYDLKVHHASVGGW